MSSSRRPFSPGTGRSRASTPEAERTFDCGEAPWLLRVSPKDHAPAVRVRGKTGHQQGRCDRVPAKGRGCPLPGRRVVRATAQPHPAPARPLPLDTLQGLPAMVLPVFGGKIHASICSGGIALLCCSRSSLRNGLLPKVSMPGRAPRHVLQGPNHRRCDSGFWQEAAPVKGSLARRVEPSLAGISVSRRNS
ncbi:hypothetical protein DSECCO2_37300 [anaerobic digester metagenome]|jgi:hypothetical protein